MALAGNSLAQVTVDTTKTTVTVKEKTSAGTKTMTIYRSLVEGLGMRNQIVYQPGAAEFGEEPLFPALNFSSEIPHLKIMLDAALKQRRYNFSRISINLLPYSDMMNALTELYTSSKEWNDYTAKASMMRTIRLIDGTEVTEIKYNTRIAADILNKSTVLRELSNLFVQYGYTVSPVEFPEDHQQTVPPETLAMLGKKTNLVIPVPANFFTLVKTTK